MATKLITSENLKRLAEQLLAAGQRVIAPVRVGDLIHYRPLSTAAQMLADADYVLPQSSFKEYLFPRSECILRYKLGPDGKAQMQEPNLDALPEQVVLGSRPCDAAGLPVLDKVFSWDYLDPFYLKRREKTTVVSLACSRKNDGCYCTSVGCAPDSRAGSDVLLKKAVPPSPVRGEGLGERGRTPEQPAPLPTLSPEGRGEQQKYIVEEITEKGAALTAKYAALFETDGTGSQQQGCPWHTEVAKVEATFDVERIEKWLDTHFEDPLWAEVAAKCLGCGTCAFICPTCHCFDIVDEGDLNGGSRLKNWDTCGAALFTRHGSGHNPRGSQEQRYRQRVMHKFKYYREKFGVRACVGCGRCSACCPVGLDLRAVLEKIGKEAGPN